MRHPEKPRLIPPPPRFQKFPGPNELSIIDKDLLPLILGSQGMPKGPSESPHRQAGFFLGLLTAFNPALYLTLNLSLLLFYVRHLHPLLNDDAVPKFILITSKSLGW